MKNYFLSAWALLVLFVFSCSPFGDNKGDEKTDKVIPLPSIEIKALIDSTTATTADTITFTLTALYLPEIKVHFPEPGSRIAGMRVVDFGEEGPNNIDTRLEYKKWYGLRADIAGTYIIPSMVVPYTDIDKTEKELQTPQIFIEVKSTPSDADNKGLEDIIDIKPLQTVSREITLFVLAGSAALILILSTTGILLYLKKKKKKQAEIQKPAHILALEALENLKKMGLIEKGVVREHYFKLSDILRRYLENRFGTPAVERTTQELLPEIVKLKGLTEEVMLNLRGFLFHSDMVKFAKYLPAEKEIDKSHQEFIAVINETKQEEKVEHATI